MNHINPLFAVEAEKLLESGYIQEAINLCNNGVKQYPDYPLGYGMLARSYIESGDYTNASRIINNSLQKFPNNKSLLNIKELLKKRNYESEYTGSHSLYTEKPIDENESLASNDNLFSSLHTKNEFQKKLTEPEFLRKIDYNKVPQSSYNLRAFNLSLIPGLIEFTPLYNKPYNVLIQNHIQSFPEIPDAPEILQSMSSKIKGLDYSQSKSQTQVANIFSVLASQIENAKITPDEDTSFSEISNNFSESSMISDTIANIYALQGAFDAAINVYQKLAAQNIQKKEYYESKISEIIKRKKSTENYFDI